jgi:hypothetical protein
MLFALGAASSALDAIRALASSGSSSAQASGFSEAATDPFSTSCAAPAAGSSTPASGTTGFSQISPSTMSVLLAAQGQSAAGAPASASTSPSGALQDLFSQIDANGDGAISKSEFENALGAGGTNLAQADDVFNKLDTNGDGSVSLQEMASALKGGKTGHHHHAHVGGTGGSSEAGATSAATSADESSDPLLQALAGATSTSVTNSDGSTTTSITNADGSKITMTQPAASTSSSSATASYNFLEQMIAREAKAISSGSSAALSVSV